MDLYNSNQFRYGGILMAKDNTLEGWNKFSMKMEEVPASPKTSLTDWIDHYLWKGGKSSEIERKVKEKAGELNHRGYNGVKRLFNLNALKKGALKPQERSLLGHIATRAMRSDFIIEINGIPINNSLREISRDEAIQKDAIISKLFNEQNAYTRIEGVKGEMRPDKVKDIKSESLASIANYLPTKIDVDTASHSAVPSKRDIYDYFVLQGFFFSREILTRYYLSLKTKPFVILSGISGTGKTKIAQLFASYICQEEDKVEADKRVAFVSVRPDWMDNKGLLGYYNILDEKYHSTPVLELLLAAKEHPEQPYFVILDEMNLAKVEHYFSDFLSILESRTPDKPEGEAMPLHSRDSVENHKGREIPAKLHIPANVFFAGTVNVDESTYMFSPKVLDRANVIEFNDVDLDGYAKGVQNKGTLLLRNAEVLHNLYNRAGQHFCRKQDYDALQPDGKQYLNELLNILRAYNLHFGYRVANEMSHFVNLAKEELADFKLEDVVDIQILQKILPKLHGTRAKLEEPLLKLIAFCIGHDAPISDEQREKARSFDPDARFPRSAQKIAQMLKQLSIQGYVSFIE